MAAPRSVSLSLDAESQMYLGYLQAQLGKAKLYDGVFKLFDQLASEGAGFISANYVVQRLRLGGGQSLARSVVGAGVRISGVPGYRIGVLRGPALAYALVQDIGTKPFNPESTIDTIKPVNAKALAMPSDENTNPGVGGAKRPLSSFPEKGEPGALHFIPFRGSGVAVGGLYAPEDIAKYRRNYKKNWALGLRAIAPLFILLSQTDIKPTFWLRDGFLAWLPKVVNALADWLRDMIAGKEVKRGS
jgi:hypothetical protein